MNLEGKTVIGCDAGSDNLATLTTIVPQGVSILQNGFRANRGLPSGENVTQATYYPDPATIRQVLKDHCTSKSITLKQYNQRLYNADHRPQVRFSCCSFSNLVV